MTIWIGKEADSHFSF